MAGNGQHKGNRWCNVHNVALQEKYGLSGANQLQFERSSFRRKLMTRNAFAKAKVFSFNRRILQVILVKWNEPYQKLASCDSSGIIFVWIKYEGRWSIELINDRNTPVTHFSWSHDGRMALICYQDGFVLVGSVAGQRYWSSMLNLESTITCGIWTPDDQQVYFGTTQGQIIVVGFAIEINQNRILTILSLTHFR